MRLLRTASGRNGSDPQGSGPFCTFGVGAGQNSGPGGTGTAQAHPVVLFPGGAGEGLTAGVAVAGEPGGLVAIVGVALPSRGRRAVAQLRAGAHERAENPESGTRPRTGPTQGRGGHADQ